VRYKDKDPNAKSYDKVGWDEGEVYLEVGGEIRGRPSG